MSLSGQTVLPAEVVIIDQSADDSLSELETYPWPFQVLRRKTAFKSLTRGRNLGVKCTDPGSEWVLFLDDDVVLCQEFIAELLEGSRRHNKALILFGFITNVRPSPVLYNVYARVFGLPVHAPGIGFRVYKSFKATIDTHQRERDLPSEWATGCAFLVRRALLDEVSFDDNLVTYCFDEDLDFSYRVSRKFPGSVWHIPTAVLAHLEDRSGRLDSRKTALMRTLYDTYLFCKNRSLGLDPIAFLLSELAYTAAIAVASVLRYRENPYPIGAHLRSYVLALKYLPDLRRGNLERVNRLFLSRATQC